MTRTLRLLLALGTFAVIAFAAPAASGSEPPGRKGDPYSIEVTPEMRRHSRIRDTLYFVGTAWGLAVPLLVLCTRISRRIRDVARRVTRKPFLVTMLFFAGFSAVSAVLDFPLTYYSGFVVPHQFDLTDRTFADWLLETMKWFGVNLAIGAPLAALAMFAVGRFKRWWLPLWLGSIPVMIFGVVIFPVFVDPLFNEFEPLKDEALRGALLQEAARAGIEGTRVYQVDKSKQTKTMNAYVTGIGPSNRIVLWDTLLQKLEPDEVLAVMGHEMGHYVLRHIWKGLGWSVLVSLAVCFLAQRAYERGLARWGRSWGVEGKGDAAALPWLLVIVAAVVFLLSPVINGISRRAEHQADVFGLELTQRNDAMARSFVKFALDSKVDPTPHPFIEFWRYSHPSLARRIEFVRTYKPWESGQPNRLWKGIPDGRAPAP